MPVIRSGSQLVGFEDLSKALKDLPKNVQKRQLQNAVNAGARVMLKAVKSRAPEHEGKQSQASQKYGTIKENLRWLTLRFGQPAGTKAARVDTGDAFWALFQELGDRFMAARPFMLPAIEGVRDQVLAKVASILGKGIEKEAKKLKGAG